MSARLDGKTERNGPRGRTGGTIRAVLWDLDGTLTDSVRFVVDTANAVIARHAGTALDFDAVGGLSGRPLEDIFRLAWPDLSDADAIAYRAEYRDLYERVAIPATKLHRGARATLRAFRRAGLRQATVTGKRAADCERILRGLGLVREIDVYLGGDSVARPKPAPDLALRAMERLGASPEESAVVGDTAVDLEMGRAAGARTVQVLWGFARDPLPQADFVVRTWAELRARILAL
ncbi:MAG: HAD family hydrolase [Candidatus Limnocylindria bacterium]